MADAGGARDTRCDAPASRADHRRSLPDARRTGEPPRSPPPASPLPLATSAARTPRRAPRSAAPLAAPRPRRARAHPRRAPSQVVFAPLYHSVSVPEISPAAYLEEYVLAQGLLQKEWMLEPMVLHTVVLIDRLLHAHSASGFHLCVSNAHRLLLVAALISSKSLDDETYNNTYWARIGGVSLEHLNELELYTCQALDWRLSVDATELQATKATLLAM